MFEHLVFLLALLYQMRVCGGAQESDWRQDFYRALELSLLTLFLSRERK